MNFGKSFSIVSDLVKNFQANEKYYLSAEYSEIDARRDFIDKFFTTLGWDVTHDIQKNPYEQEVRVERLVQVAKAQKRADYSFYLTPNFRDVKFFVEAKKPARNLVNADDFFQTVRYGWNASTPIAILTDFEEFIILDCRFRPDIGDILNSMIEKFHFTDYLDEEKFRRIYHLFSYEAVADNSIEKYAERLPKPKGKKAKKDLFKRGYQSIDEAFLEELDQIRESLAKSFKKSNPHLASEELTEATQRVIDRLVFIRFLEDKLIEPHHYLSEFGNRKSAWEDFINAGRTLDAKYNGIVFKKHFIDTQNIIEPDDKTFSFICEELSHNNSPYNFDAVPIHILGSIYERFLGKVVEATEKRVRIEEKPEVRKAGGVYYTPQYIVNYIVDNTIGKLIADKTPKQIAKMRFADIACGSGSFLITVFDKLLDYHKKWYQANPKQAEKDKCVFVDGAWRLTLLQKQKILLKNIYGVDIDQQAVEVTQLSLYLKLLEDETTATANDTWVLFKEKLLPNLSKNIVCGNSLIGTDILSNDLFDFNEEKKLKPMDFENVFPEIMRDGGFDVIVGNPPYVFTRDVEFGKVVKNYYKTHYLELIEKSEKSRGNQTGKANLYALFILRGIHLLNNSGLFSYIIPNTVLRTTVYEGIRKYLIDNTSIEKIVDLKAGVFKGVTASTVILILGKNLKEKQVSIIDNPQNADYIIEKESKSRKRYFLS
jgi:type I restriction-modification system DNA methylase subunit